MPNHFRITKAGTVILSAAKDLQVGSGGKKLQILRCAQVVRCGDFSSFCFDGQHAGLSMLGMTWFEGGFPQPIRVVLCAVALAICSWLAVAKDAIARATDQGQGTTNSFTYYVTVSGLGGEPEYQQRFDALAKDLDQIFRTTTDAHVYTLSGDSATRAHLAETLSAVARDAKAADDFVLVLIGHGSFDGADYKFNLRGPDATAAELAAWCDRIQSKRQLIVNTTSASGGSISALARPGRAVITATKNGTEKNATVFARYWVEALRDPAADVDKNEAVSALETFRYAASKTVEFYASQKRLATEHAVFEDTGKHDPVREASADSGEGLLMSSFTLLRLGSAQNAANDQAKHALLAQKEALERQIDVLKYQKASMSEDDYKQQLTAALVKLARIQEELDK